MKKYLIVLVCLLFVKNVFAQDRNANWELKVIEYYSNGMIINRPNTIFIFDGVTDSINDINQALYKRNREKFDDSIFIEMRKFASDGQNTRVKFVEYWVKPLRKIKTKDSFILEQRIGYNPFDINAPKKSGSIEMVTDDTFVGTKFDFKIIFTTESIFKKRSVNKFYCLGKFKVIENSSLSLHFNSSDTSLKYLASSFCNYNDYQPSIFAIIPSKYNWVGSQFQKICNEDNRLLDFDSLANFTWSSSKYKMKIDTTFIFRKLINNKIHKSYLERPEELITESTNNSILFLIGKNQQGSNFQYKLVPWLEYDDSKMPWIDCPINQCYVELKNIPIGKHQLYIKNKSNGLSINGYKITILPLWYQTITFKIICWSLLFLSFLGTGFWFYKRKQKRKLLAVEKQKTQIDIQLKTVRSQLNPHFIFNALSSIQSLISKTDYDKANEYLIDFSQLLRKPLNQENIATWNLNDEIELLKTYIKLEQLRTNFQFDFTIDEHINVHTISFPAMLLQPIVENAIKHGFSNSEQGELFIHIDKENRSIIITIEDNGHSFDSNHYKAGNGLALTKDYIELVNKQYPHSFVSMNFDNTNHTTKCIFTFKNWIDE